METSQKTLRALAVAAVLALVLLLGLTPVEDSAAWIVALLLGALALGALSLVRDEGERRLLGQLFCGAFALRLLFALFCYKTGLINSLGGADDTGWTENWTASRGWRGDAAARAAAATVPDSFWALYDGGERRSSLGFDYFATWFYYLLNIRSQMALAFLNCFMNALTVVMLYKSSREFFSQRASLFAAGAAAIMPGFLIWSALTIKETWLILFEITTFFTAWRFSRDRSIGYGLLTALMLLLSLGFRFYVGWTLAGAVLISSLCWRAQRPFRAAAGALLGLALLYALLSGLEIFTIDLQSIALARIEDMNVVREAVSTGGGEGAGSAVQLDYDISTPGGAAMMMLVGSSYLLLSPFPWQGMSGRQLYALPDVLLWWALVFAFILPGIGYVARRRPALLVSLIAFVLPLILFYSMIFGNVGWAYRQRAQLMPFLLIMAAAGYERFEKRRRALPAGSRSTAALARLVLQPESQRAPSAMPSHVRSRVLHPAEADAPQQR